MQNIVLFKHMLYSYLMKKALKNFKVWLFTAIMSIVGIGVPFLVLVITLNVDNATPFVYPLLHGAFAAIYLLIGYIWGDLHTVIYRRKNKNWDDELPEEIKVSAWVRRWPFFLAAASVFLVFISFEIAHLIMGGYPFIS